MTIKILHGSIKQSNLSFRKKKDTFKKYGKSNNNIQLLHRLRLLQEKLNSFISVSKQSYYSRMSTKLTKFHKSSKAYWSLLKTFLNNRKIPVIPPLYHDCDFVTNFKKKAELFNSFFDSHRYLIKSDSKLPSHLNYKTDYRLLTVNFSIDDIAKMLQNLDPNKAHGHDKIRMRMLQLCGNSICKPLELIFKQSMESGSFPSEWKKGNVVPIHKKDGKQCLINYRPVSLLPIRGKVFERLIFSEMFKFLIENELISPNQLGFKPGDSCTNQLLAITHEIYKSFDEGFEVRGVFLDISKAFDKVWHEGLIFKLKQNGISGNLINLLCDFLRNRKQRVLLNGQVSGWFDVKAGLYYLKMPVNLIQYCGTVGAFNTRKSIFQWSRKTFSSLNYVNINYWSNTWFIKGETIPTTRI